MGFFMFDAALISGLQIDMMICNHYPSRWEYYYCSISDCGNESNVDYAQLVMIYYSQSTVLKFANILYQFVRERRVLFQTK